MKTSKEKRLFSKDPLFGKKDEGALDQSRHVNVTPELRGTPPAKSAATAAAMQQQPSFAEPQKSVTGAEDLAGSKLIVGPDIKLKGVEITDCDTLVVEGRVEASMDSRVVQISAQGVFTGTATMDVAEIWGRFEGTLTARKQLVIYASGRVSGQIRYGKITVEEGGELSGDVSTLATGDRSRKPAGNAKENSYEQIPAAKQAAKAGNTV
jgi:cytoskeletal protein CcmA (bactofilin family)